MVYFLYDNYEAFSSQRLRMHTLKKGVLLSIEGIDGAGKSTLAQHLYQSLTQYTLPVILTKEPGGTALGQHIRSIVQQQTTPLHAKTEYLLFAADRAQHFHEVIIPALQNKKLIISDRMADSSLVYQGYGRGLDFAMINAINTWAMNSIQPHLTLYIQVPLHIAMQRLKKRSQTLTAFEQEKESFMYKLIEGFETLFKERNNVIILDGTQSPEILNKTATKAIKSWLQNNNLL